MIKAAEEAERVELLANSVSVLVAELNAKMKEAAGLGLDVKLETSCAFKMQPAVLSYPTLEIRLSKEIGR